MRIKSILFSLFVLFALATHTLAVNFITTNQFVVASNTVLETEHWVLAGESIVDGDMTDDLFIASISGNQLSGNFAANVWSFGGASVLYGAAQKNVRLIGTSLVVLDGYVDGNFMAAGSTVKVGPNTHVGGDVATVGIVSAIVEGLIDGDVHAIGQNVTLSAQVGGDVRLLAGEIIIQKGSTIAGDLYYTSPKELILPDGIVLGEIKRVIPAPKKINWSVTLQWFLGALLAGIPMVSLFPSMIAMSSQIIRKAPLRCTGVGLLISLVFPALGLSMIITRATFPSAMIILSVWGLLAYIGKLLVALLIGTLILRPKRPSLGKLIAALTLGLMIIYVGLAIPVTRNIVLLSVTWLGSGALLLALFNRRRMVVQLPVNADELKALREKQIEKEEAQS